MLRKALMLLLLINSFLISSAQILGGGTLFSNAVTFDQAWISGCSGAGGTSFSNQAAFEPTTALDPCAPSPTCSVAGGSNAPASDVWYKFFAIAPTATISVNPSASFNVDIQAFSGSACPGLTQIGCSSLAGTNATETLVLTGLTINQLYYFRIYGFGNSAARTGTYTFCGTAGVGSAVLAVSLSNFTAVKQNNTAVLNWATATETNNAFFEIERSDNGNVYQTIGKIAGAGNSSIKKQYSFTDNTALTAAVTYYRLKQINSDGDYKYSSIAVVKRNADVKNTVAVLNNPVIDDVNIRISAVAAGHAQVIINNNSGQLIYQFKTAVVKGDNVINVSAAGLTKLVKGIYNIQVLLNNENLNTRFVIAR